MPLQPQVDGVPVTWDDPLSVPSGANGVVNPDAWVLEITDPGAPGDAWTLWVNGVPSVHTAGSDEWDLQITDPGAEDDVWTVTVLDEDAQYTVLLGDTADDVAAGLELAIEALTGVAASVATDTVTITLDVPAAFTPTVATTGDGTWALSGAPGADTAAEVAAALEAAFDAQNGAGEPLEGLSVALAGAELTVTPDDPVYLHARLETDGAGTSTRVAGGGTPTGFDPQPTPP